MSGFPGNRLQNGPLAQKAAWLVAGPHLHFGNPGRILGTQCGGASDEEGRGGVWAERGVWAGRRAGRGVWAWWGVGGARSVGGAGRRGVGGAKGGAVCGRGEGVGGAEGGAVSEAPVLRQEDLETKESGGPCRTLLPPLGQPAGFSLDDGGRAPTRKEPGGQRGGPPSRSGGAAAFLSCLWVRSLPRGGQWGSELQEEASLHPPVGLSSHALQRGPPGDRLPPPLLGQGWPIANSCLARGRVYKHWEGCFARAAGTWRGLRCSLESWEVRAGVPLTVLQAPGPPTTVCSGGGQLRGGWAPAGG